jgi:hypothetical protein
MKRIQVSKKRRGPAPTGVGKAQLVRIHDRQLAEIDAWAGAREGKISRPEAIRRLVEIGLKARRPAAAVSGKPGRASRAAELAANAIEKIIDPSAPAEERVQRRRRLTKGPPEFREDRVDLPKAKK